MTYASLFAGIGGFDLALNRLGHTAVYVNEWDKYACDIYERKFGHRPDSRDITTIPESDIPNHDILCGGFPCQAFSKAGRQRGFEDTRGTLFFEIARIARHTRPAYLLLENVKGLLSHDLGRTFEVILRTLDELGYDTQWQVVNSKNFGVPQWRERIFFVGHRRGIRRPTIFPFLRTYENALQFVGGIGEPKFITDGKRLSRNFNQGYRVYAAGGVANTLPAQNVGGLGRATGLYLFNQRIRRLTPIECERLQGFPDGWTEGVSDTRRYKLLGNAVTVNVIEEIARRAFTNL